MNTSSHRSHGKHHGEPIFLCRSRFGVVFHCPHCQCYHVEFGNFVLDMTENELRSTENFWGTLDIDHWAKCSVPSAHVRKILIDMRPIKLKLAFTREEAEDIRALLADAVASLALPLGFAMN
ncbi:MAG: hypothetical protein EAZ92_09190 [Candidatus Kapaibacterium sp.]|nr:MAG: hypothetical protein EAZ92_09190 [Candidatus Kapabacteria bacterium]